MRADDASNERGRLELVQDRLKPGIWLEMVLVTATSSKWAVMAVMRDGPTRWFRGEGSSIMEYSL